MSFAESELRSQFRALELTTRHILGRRDELAAVLAGVSALRVLGCGSSYSVAKSTALQFAQQTGIGATAIAAGDLLVNFGSYHRLLAGAAVLLLSRSGSTSEVLAAARRCREENPDQLIISVCAVADAPIAAIADVNIELPWAFDESVCQTRTVTNLYAAGLLLAGIAADDDPLLADVDRVPSQASTFCPSVESRLSQLVAGDWTQAIVLADGGAAGLAEEGALAFKEISRTPSSFHNVLDVRHGPTVMIDGRTLVLALVSRGDRRLQADLLEDLRAQTAHVVAFSCGEPLGLKGVTEIALPGSGHDDVSAVFMAYCIQLLCLKRALQRGLDPDQPEGLAAWIELKAS